MMILKQQTHKSRWIKTLSLCELLKVNAMNMRTSQRCSLYNANFTRTKALPTAEITTKMDKFSLPRSDMGYILTRNSNFVTP